MNAPSSWLRPLQVLAVALGVAVVGLFVAWVRMEPPPPSAAFAASVVHETGASAATSGAGKQAAAPTAAAANPVDAPAPALAPASAVVLFGTVRSADGTPVTNGFCWLNRDGKQVGSASLRAGTYAFPGLRPGVHRFTSRIPDELPLDREVVVTAPTTRVDLTLAPRWLLHVNATTPEGAPLAEAIGKQKPGMRFGTLRALAFPEPLAGDLPGRAGGELEAGLGPFRANDVFGRGDGKALPKQTVGVLTLPAEGPAHVALLLAHAVIAQQPATPGQESVTFVVDPGAVFGKTSTAHFRCVDPTGAPVVGGRVSISNGNGSSFNEKNLTDEQGRFTARDLLPGRVSFGVWHKELHMPPLQTELAPGADVDLGDVTMRPGADLELSFANFGGEGSVRIFWLDAVAGSPWQATDSYHSAQNGTSQKVSLYPGRYGLLARGKGGVALLELDTAALPPGPLVFDLRPGASLQIDNRVGTGVATFEIATPRGVVVYRGTLGSRGGFALELPPGDYVATVQAGSGAAARRPFTLPAGGASLTLP